ncbi:muscle M-line assembly protein unc-89-like [Palaemon carinicauda]|uniref:muscle M-line assembly protein unc-89-like n=1 Tax=Palaemon carinicauda TaxID=392227 RepID=UPI0035B5B8BB
MDTRKELSDFWSAVFSMQGKPKDLHNNTDPQERAIQMVCRTLFLLVSDIKKERDEAIEAASKQKDEIKVCQNCEKPFLKDNPGNLRIKEGITTQSDSSEESQITVLLNAEKELKLKSSPIKLESACATGGIVPGKTIVKARKKGDPNYRCLSKSSPRLTKKKLKLEIDDDSDSVLAPETLSLDEHKLHVDVETRKALATQTVSVPETVMYGNTDFFESETIFSQDTDHIMSSNDSDKCKSPERSFAHASDLKTQLSPVLGKQGNTTPKGCRKPTRPNFESPPKEPLQQVNVNVPTDVEALQMPSTLQIDTEDLKSGNIVCQDASTPRYSPLKFTHNLSFPLSDVSFTSPSLLPGLKEKKSNVVLTPPSPTFKSPKKGKPEKNRTFKRSVSSVSDNTAKENSRSLRRHQTDSTTSKGRLYEVNIEPPDPNKRRKYKQARISEMTLVPKTDVVKLSGGLPKMSFDDELKAAFEASLMTKEKEDLMRKEKEALQSIASPEKPKDNVMNENLALESPTKILKRPKVSDHSSPFKKSKKSPKKSPSKRLRQSPSRFSPQKRKRENKQDGNKDQEVVGLDELLNQVNDSPVQDNTCLNAKAPFHKKKLLKISECSHSQGTSAPERNAKITMKNRIHSADETPKSLKQKRPIRSFVDSFDIIPPEDSEPEYAYKGPVVRKRVERMQLEGWGCRECKNWYEDEDLDPVKKKMLMNKCSRHRSKHNPITNTPEGFWNPEWVDKTQSPG